VSAGQEMLHYMRSRFARLRCALYSEGKVRLCFHGIRLLDSSTLRKGRGSEQQSSGPSGAQAQHARQSIAHGIARARSTPASKV
jgi:hypothetical protein